MSEIDSAAKDSSGVKNEVNDERAKADREATAGRYRRARKKTAVLNEFVQLTGFAAQLCGAGFTQSRWAGNSEFKAAGARQCGSEPAAARAAARLR